MLCALLAVVAACGTSGTGAELPLISPPVRAATPPGLQASTARRLGAAVEAMLHASDLRDRFFSGSGPTNLTTILGSIDQRPTEINTAGGRPCLEQAPVDYTITPFGQSVTLSAQCFRAFSPSAAGDVAFLQFGASAGKTSLYVAVGAARVAAVVTPIDGSADSTVDAWYGVGYTNATGCGSTGTFDDCSYAVTQLHANPATKAFEMSIAGIGVGFCGVQISSDGSSLHGIGSTDMGTTCNDPATLCVSAAALDTPAACPSLSFTLPALGRKAGAGAHAFGASGYPAVPGITLDGTPSDSLHFGPLAPTGGVGDFDASP
jgi:hypothetical protein